MNKPNAAPELLPCPFCGGKPKRFTLSDPVNFGGDVIECTKCQASTQVQFNFKETIEEMWNTRTPSPTEAALREALGIMLGWADNLSERLLNKSEGDDIFALNEVGIDIDKYFPLALPKPPTQEKTE